MAKTRQPPAAAADDSGAVGGLRCRCNQESEFVDRNMNRYPQGVEPDVASEFQPPKSLEEDEQIRVALEWLR